MKADNTMKLATFATIAIIHVTVCLTKMLLRTHFLVKHSIMSEQVQRTITFVTKQDPADSLYHRALFLNGYSSTLVKEMFVRQESILSVMTM